MNVLQRQMFQRGGPTSPRDIIIAERRKRGLPIRDGIMFTPDLINQVRQLQAGQSIAEIFGEVQQSAPAPDITIQEQPQQAPSESLNIGPVLESAVPSVDPRKLIEYYLNQGLNPADILEIFPAATTQMIEEVAQQKGGIINPGVRGPETPQDNQDVFIDETVLVEGGQPRTKPPIDAISEELIKLEVPKPAPTGEIDLQDPDLVDLETAVVEGQVTGQTNLGPNEYKASDGTIYKIDPNRFAEILNLENTFELQALIQNPEVEYGSNLQEIIRDTVGRRAAPFASVSPSTFKFGEQLPDYLNIQTGLRDIGGQGLDFLLEAIEGTTNLGRRALSGFYGERQDDKGDIDIFESQRYPMGEDALIGGFETGFAPDESGYLRMGISPADLDALVGRASTGARTEQQEKTQTDTQKEIDNLQQTPAQDSTEVVTAEETVTETPKAETVTTETETTEEEAPAATTEEETTARQARAEDPLLAGNPFTSSEFINFARGLSKGLAQEDTLAAGLATGAALAAEQRAEGDLELAKLDKEAEIERLKGLGFDVSDADKIANREGSLAENIRLFQKSQDNVKKIDDVINILNEGGATGFEGLRDKLITQALTFVGRGPKNWSQVDARTRADAILKVLQQENIREILGESGRTISNLDREVIKEVFGNITVLTSEAEIKQKLQNSRKKTLMSANETKGKIQTDLGFFDRINQPSAVELQNKELIEQIMAFNPNTQDTGSQIPGPQENVDLRDQNLLGGS